MGCKAVVSALAASLLLAACGGDDHSKVESGPVRIGVISDVHVFDAVKLGGVPGQPAYEEAIGKDRKAFLQSQALLQAALDRLVAAGNQIILITGDLTKDGEQFSHEALREAIAKVQAKGVKVLLIPGNHDMNNPYGRHGAIYLEQNSQGAEVGAVAPYMEHTDGTPRFDMPTFDRFYAEFGFNDAVARDSHSFSYVSEPVPGLWVMALDLANSSLPAAASNWSTPAGLQDYPPTGGSLLAPQRAQTLAWAKAMAAQAKAEGKVLLTMSHFGGIEHFTGQNLLIPDYVLDGAGKASYLQGLTSTPYRETFTAADGSQGSLTYQSSSEYVSRLLADAGIHLLLTGHFHANDIARRDYGNGNYLIDIETGATVSYPASYRQLTLDLAAKTLEVATDTQAVQGAVPEADLEGLVDGMAGNLLDALGLEVPPSLATLLNSLLLKRPLWNLMTDLYLVGQGLDPQVDQALGEAAMLAALPAGVKQPELQQMTLTTLIASLLKAHYAGDEGSNPALGASQRFAIGWLTQVKASQLQALLTAQVTALQLQDQVPASVLAQISQMVPLVGLVGYGMVNDPTPDRNVHIDLTSGKLEAR